MKTITLTFLSVLILAFSSCSSDDPLTGDNGGNSKPQRRISKIETTWVDSYDNSPSIRTETFSYDKQGRWIGYKEVDFDGGYTHTKTLSYSGNTITYEGDNFNTDIFVLKNGVIVSRGDNPRLDDYHYSNGYLIRVGEDDDDPYAKFEYTNGNLTKVNEGSSGTSTITYTDYPDKMGFSTYDTSYNDGAVDVTLNNILYQFGYFGKKSKNLIKSIKWKRGSDNSYTTYYSYKFDSEGYVTEMTEKDTDYEVTYKIYYE